MQDNWNILNKMIKDKKDFQNILLCIKISKYFSKRLSKFFSKKLSKYFYHKLSKYFFKKFQILLSKIFQIFPQNIILKDISKRFQIIFSKKPYI